MISAEMVAALLLLAVGAFLVWIDVKEGPR